jgi:hypothetical protein
MFIPLSQPELIPRAGTVMAIPRRPARLLRRVVLPAQLSFWSFGEAENGISSPIGKSAFFLVIDEASEIWSRRAYSSSGDRVDTHTSPCLPVYHVRKDL